MIHRQYGGALVRDIKHLLYHYGAMVFEIPTRPATEIDHVLCERDYEVVYFGGLFPRVYEVISARLTDAKIDHVICYGSGSEPELNGNVSKSVSKRMLRRYRLYAEHQYGSLDRYFRRKPGNLSKSTVRKGFFARLYGNYRAKKLIAKYDLPSSFMAELDEQ